MKNVFAIDDGSGSPVWASNPPFAARHLRAIEMALRKAWEVLHTDLSLAKQLSAAKKEEDISHLLRKALNDLREGKTGKVAGYSCYDFEHPHVAPEILTPAGKIKKPDLVFHLSGESRPGVSDSLTDAIFVECKLLEHANKKNVAAYCKNGILRFVEGSYSAWMREGMMLAYVRTAQSLPSDLAKTISTVDKKADLACDGTLAKCSLTRLPPPTYISKHQRGWSYVDGSGQPGPIEIRHLWLHI